MQWIPSNSNSIFCNFCIKGTSRSSFSLLQPVTPPMPHPAITYTAWGGKTGIKRPRGELNLAATFPPWPGLSGLCGEQHRKLVLVGGARGKLKHHHRLHQQEQKGKLETVAKFIIERAKEERTFFLAGSLDFFDFRNQANCQSLFSEEGSFSKERGLSVIQALFVGRVAPFIH